MKNIQNFDGQVGAKSVETNTLFFSEMATKGLVFRIEDNTAKVLLYNGESKHVYIPDYWNGYAVTEIMTGAFRDLSLVSVRLPKYLDTIGISAFERNPYLKEIDLGEYIASIGALAFDGCTALTRVKIGNAKAPTYDRATSFPSNSTTNTALIKPASVTNTHSWDELGALFGTVAVDYLNINCEHCTDATYSETAGYANNAQNAQNANVASFAETANTANNAQYTDFTNAEMEIGEFSEEVLSSTGTYYVDFVIGESIHCSPIMWWRGDAPSVSPAYIYDGDYYIVGISINGLVTLTQTKLDGTSAVEVTGKHFGYRKLS